MEYTFTEEDLKLLSRVFPAITVTNQSINTLIHDKDLVKIAEQGDYKRAYEDFIDFESSYPEDLSNKLSFEDFKKELLKGYGNSSCLQVARLIILSNGVWYDNNYVN